jgi:phage replication initiation protein
MLKNGQKIDAPPLCNTGVQNTSQSGSRALVDWVSFTLKNVQHVQDVIDILGLDSNLFMDCKNGEHGYLSQKRFGGISIFYDGREDMGIHVNISGQGCRQFETYSSMSWSLFFNLLFNFELNITRLDVAVDDFTGTLKLATIKRKIRDALITSRFRDAIEIRKTHLKDGSSKGDTVYFGSPTSDIQVRFYDKYLERLESGFEIEEGIESWVRAEIQLRDDRAYAAAVILSTEELQVGEMVKGILKNYIRFLVKGHQKNKSYWSTAPFWIKFLDNVEKLALSQQAPDRTIERTYNWIEKQADTSIALLYEAFEKDMTVMLDMIDSGLGKLNKTHLEVLNRFRIEHGKKGINFEVFKKKVDKDIKRIRKLKYKEYLNKIEKDSNGINPSEPQDKL